MTKAALLLLVLTLVACSSGGPATGGDGLGTPPPPPTDAGPPVTTPPGACTTEGAIGTCITLADRSGDLVLCTPGTRKCTGGAWAACVPAAAANWYPSTAICGACPGDGDTRVCQIKLPDQGKVHVWATGKETCTGGFWSTCQ